MLTHKDVICERIAHNGAWSLSALIGNRRVCKTFYGYTKREAIRLFVTENR